MAGVWLQKDYVPNESWGGERGGDKEAIKVAVSRWT